MTTTSMLEGLKRVALVVCGSAGAVAAWWAWWIEAPSERCRRLVEALATHRQLAVEGCREPAESIFVQSIVALGAACLAAVSVWMCWLLLKWVLVGFFPALQAHQKDRPPAG